DENVFVRHRGSPQGKRSRPNAFRGRRKSQRGRSEIQRSVVDDLLHGEEGAGLANAGQRDELVAVDAVEVRHVPDPDFEKVVEVARDEVTIQDEPELDDGLLEGCEAFWGR